MKYFFYFCVNILKMNKEQLSKHLVSVDSEKEMRFLLDEFQEYSAKKAIRFVLIALKKRRELRKKRLKTEWLGTKINPGVLNELRSKYLRGYII